MCYCCIVILHNSTSSSKRSVNMIFSISLSLVLSSKYLCNFIFMALYTFKILWLSSFTFPEPVFMIFTLYLTRPFCFFSPSTMLDGLCIACRNRPRNDLLCVWWNVKLYSLTGSRLNSERVGWLGYTVISKFFIDIISEQCEYNILWMLKFSLKIPSLCV